MVLPDSCGIPRAPQYSGVAAAGSRFGYGAFTRFGEAFQLPSPAQSGSAMTILQPRMNESTRFGLIPLRSPLLGESRLISFPSGTEMFHFPELAAFAYEFSKDCRDIAPGGSPHSDTPGSMDVELLPGTFRSLPRLSSPSSAKASTRCSCQLVSRNNFPFFPVQL